MSQASNFCPTIYISRVKSCKGGIGQQLTDSKLLKNDLKKFDSVPMLIVLFTDMTVQWRGISCYHNFNSLGSQTKDILCSVGL